MDRKEIVAAAEAYWDEHRDAIVADIAKLVEIPSTEDLAAAAPARRTGLGRPLRWMRRWKSPRVWA